MDCRFLILNKTQTKKGDSFLNINFMTKYIAIIGLFLVSMVCKAQSTNQNVSLNFYGGKKTTVGFDIVGGGKILLGLGVGMYYGESYVGEDFTGIFHWTKYSNDVYQHITAPHVAIYGITGYKVTDKLRVMVNFGMSTKQTYHNAIDKTGILGNAGWYYTSEEAGMTPLFGGAVSYEFKKFGAIAGYDTFSGPKFGISYSF